MANIPQASFVGPTGAQLQDSRANRTASLLQGLAGMFMENRKLEETQRQFDTEKLINASMDVLDNQYGGNWKAAVDADDPTIKRLFGTLYGEEGITMFDKLRESGGMGETSEQQVERGFQERLQNLSNYQNQPQQQPGTPNIPGPGFGGDIRGQFASYVQGIGENQMQGQAPQQGQSESAVPPPAEQSASNIPLDLLKKVPVRPPTAGSNIGANVLGGGRYATPARTRTTEYTEPAIGNAVGEEGMRDRRIKEVPVDPMKEGGRYAGEGYGQVLDREEMLRRYNEKENQFFPGYNELSNEEKEVAANIFEETGMVPKDKEALNKIMQLRELEPVKQVAENANSSPEEVVAAAEKIGESEESFVKAAVLDPQSVNTIIAKFNSMNQKEFTGFVKSMNLPDETANAILKKANESYEALNAKEKILYDKAQKKVVKDLKETQRPGKGGNPELKKGLKNAKSVYENIAEELGKDLQEMDPAVLGSLSANQRANFQLREAGSQFDDQLALQRESQAADIAMKWLQYNATKKAMENPTEGAVLTAETIDLLQTYQQDVETALAPIYEKYGDDPKAAKEAIDEKLNSDPRFAADFNAYIEFKASLTGKSVSQVQDSFTSGGWLWGIGAKSSPFSYNVVGGGITPTVQMGGGNQTTGAVESVVDKY